MEYFEKNSPSRVYLITYSQLDYRKSPIRHSFGGPCAHAFCGNKTLTRETPVFGCALPCIFSSKRPPEMATSKKIISETYNALVNFAKSPLGDMYAGAYRYLCKSNSFVYHGSCLERHPDLSTKNFNKKGANSNVVYWVKRIVSSADSDNKNSPSGPKKPNTKKWTNWMWLL